MFSGLQLIVRLAWASLRRRTARTLMVVLMIAMSLWGLLLMQGVYEGMYEQMINNAIRSSSGHITIQARGYRLEPDIGKRVEHLGAVEDFLKNDARVKSFVAQIKQEALAATAKYSRNAMVYGIDLHAAQRHGRLADYIRQGEYSFGSRDRGAIVGAKLAEKLKITIGKKLILSAQDTAKEVSSVALIVQGIIKTNNMEVDESGVFMDIGRVRKFLGVEKGVSQVNIILHDEAQMHGLQQDLSARFPDLAILRWDELYPALMQSRVMMKGFSYVTYLLVFCAAGLGIFGVVLVSVLERIREFGVMLAIGTEFGLIRRIILAESLFIGLLGYLAGSFLGWVSLDYFRIHGLDLSRFSAGLDAFGMDAIMYALVRPGYFVTAFVAVFAATLLSVLFPLRVLRKARPIEAIHKI